MKKIFAKTLVITILSSTFLFGCNNEKTNQVNNTTPTPTPVEDGYISGVTNNTTEEIVYKSDGFILYSNGKNNVTDEVEGYSGFSEIPAPYNNIKTLLNHDFSYTPLARKTITGDYTHYKLIASHNQLAEVEFAMGNYTLRMIMPLDLFGSNVIHVEDYYLQNENNLIMQSCLLKSGHIVENWLIEYNGTSRDDFITQMKEKDIKQYLELASEYVNYTKESQYSISENDRYITFALTCYPNFYKIYPTIEELGESANVNVTGKLVMIFDKTNGTILYNVIAIPVDEYKGFSNTDTFTTKEIVKNFEEYVRIK